MPLGIAAVLGYELYIAVEDIDHARTKTKSPQTNGICERFHRPCSISIACRSARRSSVPRSVSTRLSRVSCSSKNGTTHLGANYLLLAGGGRGS